jgi:hypothetical protein
MIRKRSSLAATVAALVAIAPASAALTACYADVHDVAYAEPPPLRYEYYAYRPGYVWAGGWWARDGGRWSWREGHYERARPGFVYVQPRWERRGDRHVFVQGGWRAGGVSMRR